MEADFNHLSQQQGQKNGDPTVYQRQIPQNESCSYDSCSNQVEYVQKEKIADYSDFCSLL